MFIAVVTVQQSTMALAEQSRMCTVVEFGVLKKMW